MRYKRGVEKLRILAGTCERVKMFRFDTEPFLKAVYAFGEVADGADPLYAVHVAVAISLSPEEVPWESSPEGTDWLANELRLSKGGFMYFWRSYLDPIWNHYIRGPVRLVCRRRSRRAGAHSAKTKGSGSGLLAVGVGTIAGLRSPADRSLSRCPLADREQARPGGRYVLHAAASAGPVSGTAGDRTASVRCGRIRDCG